MNNFLINVMKLSIAVLAITTCASYAANLTPAPQNYTTRDVRCTPKIKKVEHSKLIGSRYTLDKFNPTEAQHSCVYLLEDEKPQVTIFTPEAKFLVSSKDVKKLKGSNSNWQLDLRNEQYTCGITNQSDVTSNNVPAAPSDCSVVSESSTPATAIEASSLLIPDNSFSATVNVKNQMQGYTKPSVLCFKNKRPAACNKGEGPRHLIGSPVEVIYLSNDLDRIIITDGIYDEDDPRQTRCNMDVAAIKKTANPQINVYYANRACSVTSAP